MRIWSCQHLKCVCRFFCTLEHWFMPSTKRTNTEEVSLTPNIVSIRKSHWEFRFNFAYFKHFIWCFLGIDIPENENSFSQGWLFNGRKRDDYDSEWESFVENVQKYVYWYICHVLLSEIVRQLEPHVRFTSIFCANRLHLIEIVLFISESLFCSCGHWHSICMDQL